MNTLCLTDAELALVREAVAKFAEERTYRSRVNAAEAAADPTDYMAQHQRIAAKRYAEEADEASAVLARL